MQQGFPGSHLFCWGNVGYGAIFFCLFWEGGGEAMSKNKKINGMMKRMNDKKQEKRKWKEKRK